MILNKQKCGICGKKDLEFLFNQSDKNFGHQGEFKLYQCKDCNTIITSPRLSKKELEKYYPKDYYAFDKIITKEESLKIKLRLFLFKLYYGRNYRYHLKTLLLPFKFLIRGTRIIPGQKLLDVGGGSGQFLYEMKQCGLVVEGIEPNINKKDFNIKPDLFKAKYPNENFDVITMNHVLQHVDNPKKMLKEIDRILKKDGLFIVSASNTDSLAYCFFKEDWFQLDIPRHLFNCGDNTFIQFIEDQGFEVIKNRHNSRPNQFVVSLYNIFNINKKSGFKNRVMEVVFLPLTWMVNIFKLGDQVELWCVKQ